MYISASAKSIQPYQVKYFSSSSGVQSRMALGWAIYLLGHNWIAWHGKSERASEKNPSQTISLKTLNNGNNSGNAFERMAEQNNETTSSIVGFTETLAKWSTHLITSSLQSFGLDQNRQNQQM